MEKINVIVNYNATGSTKLHGELYLGSGVIRLETGEIIHLSRCHLVNEVKIAVVKDPAPPAPVVELPKQEGVKKPGRPKKGA